jgi:MYXO-CTERM domain-containing protein
MMKKMLAGPAVAGVLLLGTATIAEATTAPTQEDTAAEEDSDKTGLFGLIGLLGLAGLAGLKRRDNDNRSSGSHGSVGSV